MVVCSSLRVPAGAGLQDVLVGGWYDDETDPPSLIRAVDVVWLRVGDMLLRCSAADGRGVLSSVGRIESPASEEYEWMTVSILEFLVLQPWGQLRIGSLRLWDARPTIDGLSFLGLELQPVDDLMIFVHPAAAVEMMVGGEAVAGLWREQFGQGRLSVVELTQTAGGTACEH